LYLCPKDPFLEKAMIKLKAAHKNFVGHLGGEGKSQATLTAYSKDIEQLNSYLENEGVILVSEIQLEQLQNFMKGLAEKEYTSKSISRKTNATRTFFRFLHKMGHIDSNVADMLKHPKVEIKEPRILSKIEYRALRDAARNDVRSYAMIETLLQTGVTISELASVELNHFAITDEVGILTIPKRNSKDTRTIPVNKALSDALKNYIENARPKIEESIHVFITKTGKPLLVRNIRSTISRYFRVAGVENAKVNDLRHTFVAHHLSNGVSILHLSKIAGHKRLSTTEKYLKYIERAENTEKAELGVL